MVIESITIRNFMGYSGERTFNFHPDLTIIKGASGTGKTTIFRALELVTENRPRKAHLIWANDKSKEFYIKVVTKDHVITRTNRTYTLTDVLS